MKFEIEIVDEGPLGFSVSVEDPDDSGYVRYRSGIEGGKAVLEYINSCIAADFWAVHGDDVE